METQTFADYILSEKDWLKKMEIVYYLQKKAGIFYDSSVVFKTFLAKLFLDNEELGVDKNVVITACLLCNCKKSAITQDFSKVKYYAKERSRLFT